MPYKSWRHDFKNTNWIYRRRFPGRQKAAHVDKNFANRIRIIELADVNTESFAGCRQRLLDNAPETHADWRRVVERDDIDELCISTPQDLHREMTVAAFDAGKHIYCEKPMALTVVDCNAMIDAGRKGGKTLLVGQQTR